MYLNFDPREVGQTEVGWWKAHNDRNKPELFRLLVKHHVLLYSLKPDEASIVLTPLFEATQYHDTHNWEKAIEKAEKYYESVRKITRLDFNPLKAARQEVGWWKLHDKLEFTNDKSPLAKAFTELYSTIFALDKTMLLRAGKLRAQATREHDLAEDPNTPNDKIAHHWQKAGEYLVSFYIELKKQLNS